MRRSTILLILVALALPYVFVRPLLRPGHPDGHDRVFNVIRLAQLDHCVRSRAHTLRWLPDLANGYGCPLFNFYSPFLYAVADCIYAAGLSYSGAVKSVYVLGALLASVGMFFFARNWVGPCGALLAAALYVYAPYRAVDVYVRSAWLEHFALTYFPWLLWSADQYARTRRVGFLALLCATYAALVLTHTISAFLFTPVLVGYVLLLKLLHRDFSVLRALCSIALAVGLCAFFWMPAWAESPFIYSSAMTKGALDYHRHFVYPLQLFVRRWGYGLSVEGPGDRMSFQIGWTHTAFAIVAIVWLWAASPRRLRRWGTFLVVIALAAAAMMLPASKRMWEWLPLIRYVQFPWRLLMLVIFAASAVGGTLPVVAAKLCAHSSPQEGMLGSSRRRWEALFSVLGIAMVLAEVGPVCKANYLPQIASDAFTRERLLGARHPFATTSTRNEYVPIWVKEYPTSPAKDRVIVPEGIEIEHATFLPDRYDLALVARKQGQIVFNTFYFPGWTAWVDGRHAALSVVGRWGRMGLTVPEGLHKIVLQFCSTPLRAAAKWISAISAIVALLTFTVCWRDRESERESRHRI